jgi:hypothetical protein
MVGCSGEEAARASRDRAGRIADCCWMRRVISWVLETFPAAPPGFPGLQGAFFRGGGGAVCVSWLLIPPAGTPQNWGWLSGRTELHEMDLSPRPPPTPTSLQPLRPPMALTPSSAMPPPGRAPISDLSLVGSRDQVGFFSLSVGVPAPMAPRTGPRTQ